MRKSYVQVFELDLDINNTSVDWSSDPTSYNTPRTTGDPNAFTGQFKTYRWSNQIIQRDLPSFPSLGNITLNRPKIQTGKDVGIRATANVSVSDTISNDTFELPESMNDRRVTGSVNRKLTSRNYLINRPCRIITGTDPMDLSNAVVENYVVKDYSIQKDGTINFNLVDPIFYTTEAKAKAPIQSTAILAADISETDTDITYTDDNNEYQVGETGTFRIGSELMDYSVTNSTNMTITRGVGGSIAQSHSSGDVLQKAVVYQNVNVMDILTDLITNYTTIDNSYIPTSKWDALKSGDLSEFNLTNYISKPTEVRKLINQIIKVTGVSFFFDTGLQEITIVANPRFSEPVTRFTDEVKIKQNSVNVKPDFSSQITRQQINWGKTDYTEADQEQYYANGFIRIDGIAENSSNYNQEFSGETITTDWLETDSPEDAQIAVRIPQLNVERFSETPQEIKFVTDEVYIGDTPEGRVWLSSIIEIETDKFLGPDLQRITLTAQITSLAERGLNDWEVTALSYRGSALPNVDLYIDTTTQNYNLASNLNPTEEREYIVVISAGVDIGSTSTTLDSFDTGVFPAGASLRLINLGRILGAGGNGGDFDDANGKNGGNALNIQVATVIDNLSGFIGGGGGGGAAFTALTGNAGGGGGQGFNAGSGGNALNPGDDGTITAPGNGGFVNQPNFAGDGGAFGENGENSSNPNTGGLTGNAITTNGNSVTIESGNNTEQIKGPIV